PSPSCPLPSPLAPDILTFVAILPQDADSGRAQVQTVLEDHRLLRQGEPLPRPHARQSSSFWLRLMSKLKEENAKWDKTRSLSSHEPPAFRFVERLFAGAIAEP